MLAGGAEGDDLPDRHRRLRPGARAVDRISTTSPEQASRPYDKDRDGFVMGEGAGVVVLEEYEHAKARGAKIYAEVVGYGLSGDAYHVTAPHPEGSGAYPVDGDGDEEVGPRRSSDIDYINAHGTSTPLGDELELGAVRRLFGNAIGNVSMSSTKSAIGHLLGGAGAVESDLLHPRACATRSCRRRSTSTIRARAREGVDLVPHVAKEREVKAVLNNSFGFGGTNASLVMKAVLRHAPLKRLLALVCVLAARSSRWRSLIWLLVRARAAAQADVASWSRRARASPRVARPARAGRRDPRRRDTLPAAGAAVRRGRSDPGRRVRDSRGRQRRRRSSTCSSTAGRCSGW